MNTQACAALILTLLAPAVLPARASAQAAAATPAPSVDAPIWQVDADPRTRAVLDEELPDLRRSEFFDDLKVMSLRQLQAYLPQVLTDGVLARIQRRLAPLRWERTGS